MVSTEGGAFYMQDTTFCGEVCFVLEYGVILCCVLTLRRGSYFAWRGGCVSVSLLNGIM